MNSLSYPIDFPQALASIATDELEPPALLCGFGGERETVDFVAQAVASIDFEQPARSCGYGGEREVNAEDLGNRDVVVDAPSPRPPSPPIDALPSTPSRGAHHRRPATPAGVNGDMDDTGADGAVDDDDVDDEDDAGEFVAVELDSEADGTTKKTMSPGRRATDRATVYLRRHKNDGNEVLRPPPSTADPPPPSTDEDTVFALFAAAPTPVVQPPPPRRRVLRHPLLTPLTRLPWDRMISAAGSCDLLFNCKYSAQQVEDEVREERHHTTGGSSDVPSYPVATRADGYANLSLGHEYEEVFEYECCAGREEGSYHVIDDEEMEEKGEGEKCDVEEFAKLGLDCCTMLDDAGHDAEEVEVVASGPLLRLLGRKQSNANAVAKEEEEGGEEEEGHWEEVKQAAGDGNVEVRTMPSNTISSADQKAEVSWKNSNPSLDMMLYRTMLNE